ncbi:MAG: aminotransferase class I/II-fold pyridoxal phosphate-dependent enzyme [Bdellovibrionales bacterium]|nr:aminotransferase class I/II-fold pyridoxal phosphate-dependent enzyme [Bdellovibrionales bacterium]
MEFSERAKKLKGSATMNATLKAKERLLQGEDIILASVGEPDCESPLTTKQALIQRVSQVDAKYGPAQGLLSTRKVVAKWMSDLYQQDWSDNEVIITPGSKFSLYAILQILCDKSKEVIIPSPYWVSYVTLANLSEAQVKIVECNGDQDYKLSASRLENIISQNTRVLLLNSPQNPSGAIYSEEELAELAKVIKSNPHLTVICDDIYNQLIFSKAARCKHLLDFLPKENHKQIIVVHGASKSFALTGWRLGWVMAHEDIIKKLTQFQSQTITCMPDFLQIALEETLQKSSNFVVDLKETITRRYNKIYNNLNNCPGIKIYPSEGTFYLWFELLDKSKTSEQVCDELLNQHGLALVPGSSFGCEHHIRLSVTISDDLLDEVTKRLLDYFQQ